LDGSSDEEIGTKHLTVAMFTQGRTMRWQTAESATSVGILFPTGQTRGRETYYWWYSSRTILPRKHIVISITGSKSRTKSLSLTRQNTFSSLHEER